MKLSITFLVLIFSFLANPCLSQPKFNLYPDSIRVELPENNSLVVFEMRGYPKSSQFIRGFSQSLLGVLENLKKTSTNLATSLPMRIEVNSMPEGMKEVGLGTRPFGEKQLITIKPVDQPKTTMTILKDRGIVELLPPGWEVVLIAKEYRINVYAASYSDLESIPSIDFTIVADAIDNDEGMKTLGRKSIESQMIIREKKIDQKSIRYVFPGDNISLGIQGGIGLVRNIIYPELSLKLGLTFKDRFRRPNFRTSLIYNNLFFAQQTSEGFETQVNSFLSGSFEVNFNHKTNQASWSGLGIGYLVRSSGDYFKGNTAKFFITHTLPGSRFSMVPEFYLTDDFKKFTFGMTLKYSF